MSDVAAALPSTAYADAARAPARGPASAVRGSRARVRHRLRAGRCARRPISRDARRCRCSPRTSPRRAARRPAVRRCSVAPDARSAEDLQSPGPLYEPQLDGPDPWRWGAGTARPPASGPATACSTASATTSRRRARCSRRAALAARRVACIPAGVGNQDLQVRSIADLRRHRLRRACRRYLKALHRYDGRSAAQPWTHGQGGRHRGAAAGLAARRAAKRASRPCSWRTAPPRPASSATRPRRAPGCVPGDGPRAGVRPRQRRARATRASGRSS